MVKAKSVMLLMLALFGLYFVIQMPSDAAALLRGIAATIGAVATAVGEFFSQLFKG